VFGGEFGSGAAKSVSVAIIGGGEAAWSKEDGGGQALSGYHKGDCGWQAPPGALRLGGGIRIHEENLTQILIPEAFMQTVGHFRHGGQGDQAVGLPVP
jgi:hypothetical protein